jgi:hypothetical protein
MKQDGRLINDNNWNRGIGKHSGGERTASASGGETGKAESVWEKERRTEEKESGFVPEIALWQGR